MSKPFHIQTFKPPAFKTKPLNIPYRVYLWFHTIFRRNSDHFSKQYQPIFIIAQPPHSGPRPLHCWGFEITLRHTTLGRTPLDEGSVRRKTHYLTTRHW